MAVSLNLQENLVILPGHPCRLNKLKSEREAEHTINRKGGERNFGENQGITNGRQYSMCEGAIHFRISISIQGHFSEHYIYECEHYIYVNIININVNIIYMNVLFVLLH